MKTGLFFGSFNPIHTGHLMIANHFAQYNGLQQVWFVVSPHNPFKNSDELLDGHHRLEMVKLAIEGNPLLQACDIEFDLPKPSYTIDTLQKLKQQYPEKQWVLIMGSDTADSLPDWKSYPQLVSGHEILVYPRPHHPLQHLQPNEKIKLVYDVPLIEISATYVRNAIQSGKNCRYLLPSKVRQYIADNRLYGN